MAKEIVPDRVLILKVGQQLSNHGMRPPCKVTTMSRGGTVTLSGKIQYEHQRQLCLRTANGVEGVLRVVDQLQVLPKNTH